MKTHYFKTLIWVLVCAPILILGACKKDECEECQSAISHMAGKIANNNCNPNYMQEAWDKIKDNCGTYRGNLAVGYLAESCALGYNGSINCTEVATGLQFFDGRLRSFRIAYQNALPNDSLLVIASASAEYLYNNIPIELASSETKIMEYNGSNDFDTPVYFAVINIISQDTVASGMNNFNYNRTDQWGLLREVQINYNQSLQGYTLDFVNW